MSDNMSPQKQPRTIRFWSIVCASVFATLAGCGGSGVKLDPSEQATITGSVKFDGTPIPVDSGVYFSSKETNTTAGGKVDALGNFTIQAADKTKGIKKGRYHITVRPPGPPPVAASSSNDAYVKKMMAGAKAMPKATDESPLIPKEFMSVDTTKLILEVKPGKNEFPIDLAKIK